MPDLVTVGHGQLEQEELATLLSNASIDLLVDVRRFPGSRRHPSMAREEMEVWVPAVGVAYRWEERLGGRRRLPVGEVSADPWWRVKAFRDYAAHTRTSEFGAAFDQLTEDAGRRRTAIMCSETVWWRCHRRLIADVAVVGHDFDVVHLMHDGSVRPHPVAEGARLAGDGFVVWDLGGGGDE